MSIVTFLEEQNSLLFSHIIGKCIKKKMFYGKYRFSWNVLSIHDLWVQLFMFPLPMQIISIRYLSSYLSIIISFWTKHFKVLFINHIAKWLLFHLKICRRDFSNVHLNVLSSPLLLNVWKYIIVNKIIWLGFNNTCIFLNGVIEGFSLTLNSIVLILVLSVTWKLIYLFN